MSEKMMWQRLKSMRCPKCNKQIVRDMLKDGYKCQKCDFFIGKEKFNQVVSGLYEPKNVGNYQDNQEQLNNL